MEFLLFTEKLLAHYGFLIRRRYTCEYLRKPAFSNTLLAVLMWQNGIKCFTMWPLILHRVPSKQLKVQQNIPIRPFRSWRCSLVECTYLGYENLKIDWRRAGDRKCMGSKIIVEKLILVFYIMCYSCKSLFISVKGLSQPRDL